MYYKKVQHPYVAISQDQQYYINVDFKLAYECLSRICSLAGIRYETAYSTCEDRKSTRLNSSHT